MQSVWAGAACRDLYMHWPIPRLAPSIRPASSLRQQRHCNQSKSTWPGPCLHNSPAQDRTAPCRAVPTALQDHYSPTTSTLPVQARSRPRWARLRREPEPEPESEPESPSSPSETLSRPSTDDWPVPKQPTLVLSTPAVLFPPRTPHHGPLGTGTAPHTTQWPPFLACLRPRPPIS